MSMSAETISKDIVAEPAKDPAGEVASNDNATANDNADPKKDLADLAKGASARWRETKRLREQRKQVSAREAAKDRELHELRTFRQHFQNDPLALAEAHGLTAEQLARRVIQRGSPDEKFEALQREIASLKEQREEEHKRLATMTWERTKRAAEDEFLTAAKSADKCPTISKMAEKNPKLLLRMAHELARDAVEELRRQGKPVKVSPQKLAEALEREFADGFASGTADLERTAGSSATKGEANGHGLRGDKAGTPRTLTNGHATERGSKPASFDDLPDKEQNKRLLAQYRIFK